MKNYIGIHNFIFKKIYRFINEYVQMLNSKNIVMKMISIGVSTSFMEKICTHFVIFLDFPFIYVKCLRIRIPS